MTTPPATPDHTLRDELTRLATNLRWAWHQPTHTLLRRLAGEGWEASGRNPLEVVRRLSDDTLTTLAADDAWRRQVHDLHDDLRAYLAEVPAEPDHLIAYLSAEFALADGLATYSGGLGVLAGDHLRSASDLGLPLVAIGLAYHEGYFQQTIDGSGWQQAHPAVNDWAALPLEPVVDDEGATVTVTVPTGEGPVVVRAWRAEVGRVELYLLDTDLDANGERQRTITGQLYGGDQDLRLRQELVLGVGGVRLLETLGIRPTRFHLNEGHAALAGLARLQIHRGVGGSLDDALAKVRTELLFTTHTPVPAGHDTFDWGLAHHHLQPLALELGTDFPWMWDLAADGDHPRWNQTALALRMAGRTNGVARLHGAVSRRMFAHLWPGRAVDEVPIGHVTNGVHPSTWVGPDIAALLDRHAPGWDGRLGPDALDGLSGLDHATLWQAHERARARLLAAVGERLDRQATREGTEPAGMGLDPHALTIGFARRFATYKRGTLLARDVDRLGALLSDTERPVQVIVAGKAHPADAGAQQLIADLVALSRDPRLAGRLAVVEGYDLELAALLVAGCDVWLNTPLRPLEASGTSGMKAAMNGGLNLSVLDGWWDEAVADVAPLADVGIGWVIGDDRVVDDRDTQDARDAESLYHVLTEEVVPTFHDRGDDRVPTRWVTMMLDALRLLGPRFSSHRMVRDYLTLYTGVDGQ